MWLIYVYNLVFHESIHEVPLLIMNKQHHYNNYQSNWDLLLWRTKYYSLILAFVNHKSRCCYLVSRDRFRSCFVLEIYICFNCFVFWEMIFYFFHFVVEGLD